MLDRLRIAAVALTAIAATVEAAPAGKWNLVVAASDEFDGVTLDAAKWKKGLWYDTSGVLAFRDENVTVSGGSLVLTARKEAFNEKSYTCGAVESLFDVPGVKSYVELRAKALPRAANVLSAVWMQSSPLTAANNPNPEIDIQETFNYSGLVSTLHTWAIDPDRPTPTTPGRGFAILTKPAWPDSPARSQGDLIPCSSNYLRDATPRVGTDLLLSVASQRQFFLNANSAVGQGQRSLSPYNYKFVVARLHISQ